MTRRIFIPVAAALAVLISLAGYLYAELDQRSASLAATRATLADTRVVLQETDQSLAAQVAQNADLRQANDGLQGAIGEWQAALADKESELSTANAEIAVKESELSTVNAELADKESELSTVSAELAVKESELTDSRRSLDALDSQHRTLQGQYDSLQDTEAALRRDYNTLEDLYGGVEALREEIAELEAKRRPLILAVDTDSFACTGSMEPKITCLDEATWLENPKPEEIVVGTVITFYPDCLTDEVVEDAAGTAHRVMDIKVENGVYSYWPKGDANEEPDGCWVPFDHVQGYIIEIHKDVRPENAVLRDFVNDASAKEREARDAFLEARADYFAIIERYCGVGVNPGDCLLASPEYEIAIAAHRVQEDAFEEWERWSEYHSCALDSARNAWYYTDGSPPLFLPCPLPLAIIVPPS